VFFVFARLTHECRKISNLIQHTRSVAKAQNYNSRKFGLKMYFFKIRRNGIWRIRFRWIRFRRVGFRQIGTESV